ncbi:MAG: transketolase [Thermaerobacter sp.]|nr:transketolase [Thermaerobacter sp.]
MAHELDNLAITTIRTLAMDGVEAANSGHPGMPMGAAPMAYVLWTRFLRHNPQNPHWWNRDRFVLSAGHGSMLLYALLHLTGYDLGLEDLKRFRQWGSKAPGHPEYGLTPGVETTTGPLGQGFATGVGLAMAERHLAARYNREGCSIIDHYTYAIVGDGDLMEGVSSEAASLAGHLKLGKLIYLYDDNHVSIEGDTSLAFTEDAAARFRAYGWHVQRVADGNDLDAIEAAITTAQAETEQPSLIAVRTHIGYGSPHRQDTSKAHGEPLGADEMRLTKAAYGWPVDQPFFIPDQVLAHFRAAGAAGADREREWRVEWDRFTAAFSELAEELTQSWTGAAPPGWDANLPVFAEGTQIATRSASGQVLNALARNIPWLGGGSADLAPSNLTRLTEEGDFGPGSYAGRNFHFGVREHAMGGILNGMALHGGMRVYGGTFLIFSDYMLPPIRLASLMGLPVTYVFTHDSIGLGEDGPTHQPIEQLAGLRAMPELIVLRPADANETREAWAIAVTSTQKPVALALSRQNLPVLPAAKAAGTRQGGYILLDAANGRPEVILLASGSEVALAVTAREALELAGIATRVVSMPSWEIFDSQPADYRRLVLPPDITARVAIEAASPMGWERYVGLGGAIIAMPGFGASAPAGELFKHFGFTVDNVVATAKRVRG